MVSDIDVTHLADFAASSRRVAVSSDGTVRVVTGSGPHQFDINVVPRLSGSDLNVQPLRVSVSDEEVRARMHVLVEVVM